MATIFFALFLFMSVLLLLLVVDENNIRRISEQKELNEHMLMETRMRIWRTGPIWNCATWSMI